MDLNLPINLGIGYKSLSQVARKLTEAWTLLNFYCPGCGNILSDPGPNTKVFDFYCKYCGVLQTFQLKSQKKSFGKKILGAEYNKVINSFETGTHASLILLEYDKDYKVRNLFLFHRNYITLNCIQPRPPLGPNAKRAGWQGCHILLDQLPEQRKILVVNNGVPIEKSTVLRSWKDLEEASSLSA